jgi:transglutaminase-like putative cysteine protease
MLLDVGCEISFTIPAPASMVLMLNLHPSIVAMSHGSERSCVVPSLPTTEYVDLYGNRCTRVFAPAGRVSFRHEALVETTGLADPQVWNVRQLPVRDLPDETLVYLLPSRYCEVDSELKELAWTTFGRLPAGWPLVQGICNFVNAHIRFDYMLARANRTALDVYRERVGVCRDFMHLAITFCRCLNVPARYCTGYLGDIGVPAAASPMDFSAWFEVYLGGQWYAFDARNNVPRIGRTLIARGRDAADVALTTIFGLNRLESFSVRTVEVAARSMV